MNRNLRIGATVIATAFGAVGGVLLNFLLTSLLISDPCAYHNGKAEASFMFTIFFDLNGGNGYHPEPSAVNLMLSVVLGGFLGWKLRAIVFDHYETLLETEKQA